MASLKRSLQCTNGKQLFKFKPGEVQFCKTVSIETKSHKKKNGLKDKYKT